MIKVMKRGHCVSLFSELCCRLVTWLPQAIGDHVIVKAAIIFISLYMQTYMYMYTHPMHAGIDLASYPVSLRGVRRFLSQPLQ